MERKQALKEYFMNEKQLQFRSKVLGNNPLPWLDFKGKEQSLAVADLVSELPENSGSYEWRIKPKYELDPDTTKIILDKMKEIIEDASTNRDDWYCSDKNVFELAFSKLKEELELEL